MKTTKTRIVKKMLGKNLIYIAEICDDETGEVLVFGVGGTPESARSDARLEWKKSVSELSS